MQPAANDVTTKTEDAKDKMTPKAGEMKEASRKPFNEIDFYDWKQLDI
jgi:hypothetical protein